jgi:hypothetical protein
MVEYFTKADISNLPNYRTFLFCPDSFESNLITKSIGRFTQRAINGKMCQKISTPRIKNAKFYPDPPIYAGCFELFGTYICASTTKWLCFTRLRSYQIKCSLEFRF